MITECEWFYVFDIIEGLYNGLKDKDRQTFENEINACFILNGVGWKITNGIIEIREDENFEIELSAAVTTLEKANLHTAKTEIREALIDLSKRPEPDVIGAIQQKNSRAAPRWLAGEKEKKFIVIYNNQLIVITLFMRGFFALIYLCFMKKILKYAEIISRLVAAGVSLYLAFHR